MYEKFPILYIDKKNLYIDNNNIFKKHFLYGLGLQHACKQGLRMQIQLCFFLQALGT